MNKEETWTNVDSQNDIERGRLRCEIHTSSIGPTSRISFFSVGMNLTRTFCSCKYLSLKAESCALKSKSYIVCSGTRSSLSLSLTLTTINRKTKAIAYPPSSLMGNNTNIHLVDPQKQSSFLVSLQNSIWLNKVMLLVPKEHSFFADYLQQEANLRELKLQLRFLFPQELAFSSTNCFCFLSGNLLNQFNINQSTGGNVIWEDQCQKRVLCLTILRGVKIAARWKWTTSFEWWDWTENLCLLKKMCTINEQ